MASVPKINVESPEKSLTTEAQRARRKKKVEVQRSFLCELP